MRHLGAAALTLTLLLPAAAAAQGDEPPRDTAPKPAEDAAKKKDADVEVTETKLAPLQAREVIEKLKTLRAQILLDEEYNRLLEIRVKRMELEAQLGLGAAPAGAKKKEGAGRVSGVPPPPSQLDLTADKQLVVKSVTVQPFKEAFVVYKGRTYTVRPGDTLGDISIRDITQNGVVTNKSSVMLEP